MGTLRDLINSSFRLINVLGQNKVAGAADLNNALYALDTMQDSWSNEKLMVYSIKPYIFYTQQNQQVYTLGPQQDNPGSILELQLPPINAGDGNYLDGTYNGVPISYAPVTSVVTTSTIVSGTNNTFAGTWESAGVGWSTPPDCQASGSINATPVINGITLEAISIVTGYGFGHFATSPCVFIVAHGSPGSIDQDLFESINLTYDGVTTNFAVEDCIFNPEGNGGWPVSNVTVWAWPVESNSYFADGETTTVEFIAESLSPGNGMNAFANVVVNLGQIIDLQVVNSGPGGYDGINYKQGDKLTVLDEYLGGNGGTGLVFTPAAVTAETDWIIERPMKIEKAYTIYQTGTAQPVDIPIQLLTMEQYASITTKDVPSTFPFGLYDDNAWPVRNITVFPIPLQQTGVRLWLRQPLITAELSALDAPIDFPPGYERAFRYGLACELAAEYMKSIPPRVEREAAASKVVLKQLNQAPRYKLGDGSLSRRNGPRGWNWITGVYGWGPFH